MEVLIKTADSSLWVIKNYTKDYYDDLSLIPLIEEPPIMVHGKLCHQRRNIGFYSDSSIGYKYSGQLMKSIPLTDQPILKEIMEKINQDLGTNFNGILINKYINGEKYIGAHSDNEKGLDKNNKMVVGLSYGPGVRTFRIRDKKTKKIVLDYKQEQGTLLCMCGEFQSQYTHEIPKELKIKEERISLTFRYHTI